MSSQEIILQLTESEIEHLRSVMRVAASARRDRAAGAVEQERRLIDLADGIHVDQEAEGCRKHDVVLARDDAEAIVSALRFAKHLANRKIRSLRKSGCAYGDERVLDEKRTRDRCVSLKIIMGSALASFDEEARSIRHMRDASKAGIDYPLSDYVHMVKKYMLAGCRFPDAEWGCVEAFWDSVENDIYSSSDDRFAVFPVSMLEPADNGLEQEILECGSVESVVGAWPCAKLREALDDVFRKHVYDDDEGTIYWSDEPISDNQTILHAVYAQKSF